MNQCIINVVEKSVFIAFKQIVKRGSVEIWKINGNELSIKKMEITNTNFEQINIDFTNGKYRLEILIDGQQILKTININ